MRCSSHPSTSASWCSRMRQICGLYDSIATSFYMVIYANSKFLNCITNTEIRKATLEMIKKQRCTCNGLKWVNGFYIYSPRHYMVKYRKYLVFPSHAVLTAPFNFGFLVFTNATDLWRDFEYRGLYDSIATSLYMVKYAKNFFLYCITNTEIRKATLEMIKKQRCM